ncbi:MAG: heme exporter protein CcmD [Paracoccaceae bacterium]
MPELGKYAATVLAAYGATILLLAVLVAVTWAQGARMRRMLKAQEDRMAGETR